MRLKSGLENIIIVWWLGNCVLTRAVCSVVWREETIPRQWGEGNLFKKGDREDPGNCRGITLLSVVGKTFRKVLNIV